MNVKMRSKTMYTKKGDNKIVGARGDQIEGDGEEEESHVAEDVTGHDTDSDGDGWRDDDLRLNFSSSSGDDYITGSSDLESSERDVAIPEPSDTNTSKPQRSHSESDFDDNSVPVPRTPRDVHLSRPIWVTLYPPEAELDTASKFRVRSSGI
ncbi:hypothetical protein J6590_083926 [Homalodisca vitripennis]|nr:hypothetical protein J6590_083926 [Homalodisca vitripennis]